jgi:hypothetical protein
MLGYIIDDISQRQRVRSIRVGSVAIRQNRYFINLKTTKHKQPPSSHGLVRASVGRSVLPNDTQLRLMKLK